MLVQVGFAGGVEVGFPGGAVQGGVERGDVALGGVDGVLALGGVLVAVFEGAAAARGRWRCCVVGEGGVFCFC